MLQSYQGPHILKHDPYSNNIIKPGLQHQKKKHILFETKLALLQPYHDKQAPKNKCLSGGQVNKWSLEGGEFLIPGQCGSRRWHCWKVGENLWKELLSSLFTLLFTPPNDKYQPKWKYHLQCIKKHLEHLKKTILSLSILDLYSIDLCIV